MLFGDLISVVKSLIKSKVITPFFSFMFLKIFQIHTISSIEPLSDLHAVTIGAIQ